MSEKTEKNYTVKTVKTELDRLEKTIKKKFDKLEQLKSEIKAEEKRKKELEKIYETLNTAALQQQITEAWFKGKKMTGEQIAKILEISDKISDKIDNLDVGTAVKAISQAYDEQKKDEKDTTEENVSVPNGIKPYTSGYGGVDE